MSLFFKFLFGRYDLCAKLILFFVIAAPLWKFFFKKTSERIAKGEMEGLIVLKAVDIVETALARVVRQMEADAPVETQDKEVQVVADADACADG